jgi:hypothetical protein
MSEAYTELVKVLGECLSPTQFRKCVLLSLGADGVVSMKVVSARKALVSDDPLVDERAFTVRRGVKNVLVPLHSARFVHGQGVATTWSDGLSVFWILSTQSRFIPKDTAPMVFETNLDFELYDLPDKYIGILATNFTNIERLECEAFSSDVICATRKTRPAGTADCLHLGPPTPHRALQRPTDVGFDATKNSVDVLSARQFVKAVFEAYGAIDGDKAAATWEDPLGCGRWDETRGKLLWLILGLDEDDLHAFDADRIDRMRYMDIEHGFEFPDRYFIILLLHAPWFITANTLDTLAGVCVPYGCTVDGLDAWWDQSPAKWKSQWGIRALESVHEEITMYQMCTLKCEHNLYNMIRDSHDPDCSPHHSVISGYTDTVNNDSLQEFINPVAMALEPVAGASTVCHVCPENIEYSGYKLMCCSTCSKITKDQDRNVWMTSGDSTRVKEILICATCQDSVFTFAGYVRHAKCSHDGCVWKSRAPLTCDCSSGEQLAVKQRATVLHMVTQVKSHLSQTADCIRSVKKRTLYVRARLSDESADEYTDHKNDLVQDKLAEFSSAYHLVSVRCALADDAHPVGAFDTSGLEASNAHAHASQSADGYAATAMNSRWTVVAVTRDAVCVAFDAKSKVRATACVHCHVGTCELWADKAFHCVACNKWQKQKKRDKSVFPCRRVADVSLVAAEPPDTYAVDGREIPKSVYFETFLRAIASRYY